MARRLISWFSACVLALAIVPALAPAAHAQGFLERIFGPRTYPPPGNVPTRFDPYGRPMPGYSPYGYGAPPGYGPPGYLPPNQADQPRPVRPSEPPLPKIVVVPKDPDAVTVLVVGDVLASSVADGLIFTYGDEPKLNVVDRTSAGSGLVRDDAYDWEKQLPAIINQVKPGYIVFMAGTNDRQPMRTSPTQREAVRTEPWETVYRKRIDGILATLKAYNKPYYWVGLPPMASAAASADMAYFNGLFKARVDAAGGRFIDVWNGFADENGAFTLKSPDADGQVRTMRLGDGVNFTKAGSIKLAYYVDRDLRKKDGGPAESLATSATMEEKIEIGPRGERWLVGPVLSLTDPPPGAAGKLVGATEAATPAESSAQYKLVVEGRALPVVAGRADDTSWPPMKPDFGPALASLPAAVPAAGAAPVRPAAVTTPSASRTTAPTAPRPTVTAPSNPAPARTTSAPQANSRPQQPVQQPQQNAPGRSTSTFFGTPFPPYNGPVPPAPIGGR